MTPTLRTDEQSAKRTDRIRLLVVLGFVALIVLCGWFYLAAMVGAMLPGHDMAELGPGMSLFNLVNGVAAMDEVGRALLASLCVTPGISHFGMPGAGVWGLRDLALVFAMWVAMSAGMMLPTAVPMILSYVDSGQGAARTIVLSLGYLAVWIAFSLLATLAQWGLTSALVMTPAMASASGVFAGSIFLMAGAYQFTPLKSACLAQCRNAFPLAGARPQGPLASGVYQGLICLGCCWALMALMFAVGAMNIVWMAALGAVMATEKLAQGPWLTRLIGIGLLAIGAGLWLQLLVSRGVLSY